MSVARHLSLLLAVIAASSMVAVVRPRRARGAAQIVVNTPADGDVDDAACSLREAIIAANTNASYHGCLAVGAGVADEIVFDLGPGTPTINIGATPLPAITEWVTIDGGARRVELRGPGGPLVSQHHGLNVARAGFGTVLRNLVVNNFADDGVFIDADEVYVFGCFIGTDPTGTIGVPNQGFGVQVFGGNGVRLGGATSGGPCTGDCNVIAGATPAKANVLLDLTSTGALVRGNFIGTDVTGTAALAPSITIGIVDKGLGNRIGGMSNITPGGPCTGDCNLISGNTLNGGVVIDKAASGSVVQGNFIGTDVTGNSAVTASAGAVGILVFATGAVIGGTTPAARNVVSGNPGIGVFVGGLNTTVQGNYLGTNAAGTAAVPNSGTGVLVSQADGAMIGGTVPGAGNLISGASNSGYGVALRQTANAHVLANLIGTAADGTTPLPNLSHGVLINDQASNNVIGDPIANAGNTIAFNGGDGVHLDGSMPQVHGNAIHGNSIYSNGGAGIALTAGANDNIAPPSIAGIDPLHGTSCAPCFVEIFSDAEDEGRVLEIILFTDDGNWTFDGPLSGPHVTATNTDLMSGSTSAFSAPVFLPTSTATPSATLPTSTATATAASTHTRTGTATSTRTASAAASRTATGTGIPSPTNAPPAMSSPTATAILTPLASPTHTETAVSCAGDCDDDHVVSISELITGVNIALGGLPVSACPAFENGAGIVDIAQLITGVRNALNGCSGSAEHARRAVGQLPTPETTAGV